MNDGVGRVPKNLFGLYLHMHPYRDVKLILHYQPYAAYFNLEWTWPVKRFLTAHLIPEILILGKKAVQFQQYITVFLNNKEMKEICGANIKDNSATAAVERDTHRGVYFSLSEWRQRTCSKIHTLIHIKLH